MNEFICVSFECRVAVVFRIRRAAVFAAAVDPGMLDASVPNASLRAIELDNREFAVGELAAVEAAAGEQACELGNRDAKELLVHDVVYTFI